MQFAQANAQTKNCKRASTSPTQKRISKYFFQRFKKNKTPATQARQKSIRQMTQTDDIKMVVTHDRQERQPITGVTVAQLLHKLLKSEKPQKQSSLQPFRRGLVFQSSLGR